MSMHAGTTWTQDDFGSMSWHDNHVHALQIREGEHGTGELTLDLDFIVEWLCAPDGSCRFRVAPASLVFHEAADLVVSVNYADSSAALVPFSIHQIARREADHTFRWRIELNWPAGFIELAAAGYTQTLRADPIETSAQCLTAAERSAGGSL